MEKIDIKYAKKLNMRDTQKDMLTASEHNNIVIIQSIALGEKTTYKMVLTSVDMIATHNNKNHHLRYVELAM